MHTTGTTTAPVLKRGPFYYAEHCPYGTSTKLDCNVLYRFDRQDKRDEWVEQNDNTQPLSRKIAIFLYPDAFDNDNVTGHWNTSGLSAFAEWWNNDSDSVE